VSHTSPSTILVIAKAALIQTLMCSLVELSGHNATQARGSETVTAAIQRVRPDLLLLDCEHDCACEQEAHERRGGGFRESSRAPLDGAPDPPARVFGDARDVAARLIFERRERKKAR
jgi:CheY-like chemotaxis protein